MLKEGKAREAIAMILIGALTAMPLIVAITPLFLYFVPKIFDTVKIAIPFILIFISAYTILREKYIWTGLVIFIFAGLLGFGALNIDVQEPLLPLLSGLFGGSGLILSIVQKTKIPKQRKLSIKEIKLSKSEYGKAVAGTIISAPLCSFLPAIGSGHAATISSEIIPQSRRGFLIMIGAINIIVMVLSFATLHVLEKTRTGASVAVKEILGSLALKDLWIIIAIAIITIIITSFIALKLTNIFVKILEKINYQLLSGFMLSVLVIVVLVFSNWLGLLVFITSTATGIFTILSNTRRINLMGVLLAPTIILYLF